MNLIQIYPETCASFNSVIYEFCLPNKVACNTYDPDGLLTICGNEHNCNTECNGSPYFINAVGEFYLQTNFKTSSAPVVEFLDINKNNNNGAYSPEFKKGIQIYKIYSHLVEADCFQVRISAGGINVCSQFFKKTNECDDYVSLEGVYNKKDCIGQVYNGVTFSNKIHLKGKLKYYNTIIEDDGTRDIYRFYPSESIAPFMMKYLGNVILGAKTIKVNDKDYEYQGSGNLTPLKSGMYAPILEFSKRCGGDNLVCEN